MVRGRTYSILGWICLKERKTAFIFISFGGGMGARLSTGLANASIN